MSFGGALREPASMAISHYIKNFRLVQAKRNVLKKVVSRADATPTFDELYLLDATLELKKTYQTVTVSSTCFLN